MNKAEVLKAYPHIPLEDNGLELFLWGDPVFDDESLEEKAQYANDQLLAHRREGVLTILEALWKQIKELRAANKSLTEHITTLNRELAVQALMAAQLLKYVEATAPQVARQVLIDWEVNEMDPDFCLRTALPKIEELNRSR